MNEKMRITSVHNDRIKRLVALQQKSQLRRDSGIVVVEGRRELKHCIAAGHEVVAVYHCPDLTGDVPGYGSPCYEVTREVYEKIAYRGSTEGIIAEVHPHPLTLADLQLPRHPLVMVLEAVEKPGNLGAVLRSADAAPADAVIVCDPLTDLYNPNIIRSSIGAIFTVPTVCCTSAECIQYLKTHDIQILTAQLQDDTGVARCRRCPHPHTYARAAGLAQRVGQCRHPAVRGGSPARELRCWLIKTVLLSKKIVFPA